MPIGTPTVQNQLELKLNEARSILENAKDSLSRLEFSRELFNGFIADVKTKLDELDLIQ